MYIHNAVSCEPDWKEPSTGVGTSSKARGSELHVCVTGASGSVGSHVVEYLLSLGHTITALDIVPLPEHLLPLPPGSIFLHVDLSDFSALEQALGVIPCDGIVHFGAFAHPLGRDPRIVHNHNVIASYNVLRTAADLGIKRIVQASSCNATGSCYSRDEFRKFDELPLHENSAAHPEDPYSLSKLICEVQADSIARLYSDVRIASLRFHCVCTREEAQYKPGYRDLWGWTSFDAANRACLAALLDQPNWENGHEVFYIIAENLALSDQSLEVKRGKWKNASWSPSQVGALELLETAYPGTKVREGWWVDRTSRKGFFDTTKAQRLLGWTHDGDLPFDAAAKPQAGASALKDAIPFGTIDAALNGHTTALGLHERDSQREEAAIA